MLLNFHPTSGRGLPVIPLAHNPDASIAFPSSPFPEEETQDFRRQNPQNTIVVVAAMIMSISDFQRSILDSSYLQYNDMSFRIAKQSRLGPGAARRVSAKFPKFHILGQSQRRIPRMTSHSFFLPVEFQGRRDAEISHKCCGIASETGMTTSPLNGRKGIMVTMV